MRFKKTKKYLRIRNKSKRAGTKRMRSKRNGTKRMRSKRKGTKRMRGGDEAYFNNAHNISAINEQFSEMFCKECNIDFYIKYLTDNYTSTGITYKQIYEMAKKKFNETDVNFTYYEPETIKRFYELFEEENEDINVENYKIFLEKYKRSGMTDAHINFLTNKWNEDHAKETFTNFDDENEPPSITNKRSSEFNRPNESFTKLPFKERIQAWEKRKIIIQ